MRRATVILVLLACWPWPALADLCGRPGLDGAAQTGGVLNGYFAAPEGASLEAGQRRLPLGASRGVDQLDAGDLLLLIQMQGADLSVNNTPDYGDGSGEGRGWQALRAGQFELLRVERFDDREVVIRGAGDEGGLRHDYPWREPTGRDQQGRARWQLVRMPQYQTLTLTGDIQGLPWDGATGGVVALDVRGELSLDGHRLDAAGIGFRGGAALALDGALGDAADWYYPAPARAELAAGYGQHASKGEGLAGSARWLMQGDRVIDSYPGADRRGGSDGYPGGSMARGAPGNAGGGGNSLTMDNTRNSGGGGGGGGSPGGTGLSVENQPLGGRGGAAVVPDARLLSAGGGGGAGSRRLASANDSLSAGGAGGGIILLRAGRFVGPGSISVAGADGQPGGEAGAGGGGGGGSLLLLSPFAELDDIDFQLAGGRAGKGGGAGGDGGAGRLLLDGGLALPELPEGLAVLGNLGATSLVGVAPGYQCQPMGTLLSGRVMVTGQPATRRPEGDGLAGLAVRAITDEGEVLAETVSGPGGHFAIELPETLAGEVLTLEAPLPAGMIAVDASESDLPLAPMRYQGDGRWRFRAGEGLHYNMRLVLIQTPQLQPPPAREIAPGNTEIFLFRYLAHARSQVRFRYQPGEAGQGWRHTFFLDPQCDGESSHVGRDVSQWLEARPGAPVCVRVRVEVPADARDGNLMMTIQADTRLGETPLPVELPALRETLDIRARQSVRASP